MKKRLLMGLLVLLSSVTNVANAALELIITDGIDSARPIAIVPLNGKEQKHCLLIFRLLSRRIFNEVVNSAQFLPARCLKHLTMSRKLTSTHGLT